jgi:hypothetical protein
VTARKARLHDVELERCLLGAVILDSTGIPRDLPAEAFHHQPHQAIWRAMLALSGQEFGVGAIKAELGDAGTPSVREALRIAEENALSSGGHRELSDRLQALHTRRQAHDAARRVLTAAEDDDATIPEVLELAEGAFGNIEVQRPKSAIYTRWAPLARSFLTDRPPNRRWLLRHPPPDGKPCPPGSEEGMLPRGKVGGVFAEGGVGKTNMVIALAISVITGRPLFDHFLPEPEAREGRVLLLLGEEDVEEVHRRVHRVARAYQLSEGQQGLVAERLIVVPLAAASTPLLELSQDGSTLTETSHLADLVERIRATDDDGQGFSLVVLDPLSRFAGPTFETDNAAATRVVQMLETLTQVPGNPTVLAVHHSSKAARNEGKVNARGSSALTDAMRWTCSLRFEAGEVLFLQEKSNYSRRMTEPVVLLSDEGILHVPNQSELFAREDGAKAAAMKREEEKEALVEAKIDALKAAILASVRTAATPFVSADALVASVKGGSTALKKTSYFRLVAEGALQKGEGLRGEIRARFGVVK